MEGLKKTTKRKLKHAKKRAKELKKAHGGTPGKTHTYHGGWDLGYWEGRASMAQDILDEVGELDVANSKVDHICPKCKVKSNWQDWDYKTEEERGHEYPSLGLEHNPTHEYCCPECGDWSTQKAIEEVSKGQDDEDGNPEVQTQEVNMKFGIYLDGELIAERDDIFEAYKEAIYATTVLGVPHEVKIIPE